MKPTHSHQEGLACYAMAIHKNMSGIVAQLEQNKLTLGYFSNPTNS